MWDEREEQWRLSGKIYRTQNFTQSAEGHKDSLWTTVLSAAVMINYRNKLTTVILNGHRKTGH